MHRLLRLHYGEGGVTLTTVSATDAGRAFAAYFGGDLAALDCLVTETGGTPFQRQVWSALRTIPTGETLSYAGLAAQIGRPSAVRAVRPA